MEALAAMARGFSFLLKYGMVIFISKKPAAYYYCYNK